MTQVLGGFVEDDVHGVRVSVVAPVGELDLHRHAELRAELLDAVSSDVPVVVDMARVTFMDSSAIGLIVGTAKRCREAGGDLRVVNAGGQPLRVMRLTGLDQLVSVEEAGA
jgi:anti-anti-sigma factor